MESSKLIENNIIDEAECKMPRKKKRKSGGVRKGKLRLKKPKRRKK